MNVPGRILVTAFCIGILYINEGLCVGDCAFTRDNVTAVSPIEWEFGLYLDSIRDTATSGTVLLDVMTSNVMQISSVSSSTKSNLNFMEPVLRDGRFVITLTDDFARYEELETTETMKITVSFNCTTDARNIEIYQPIIDTNNHYPEFENASYIYSLPIPLPANFPIHFFGTISARDIDITNKNISFSLSTSDPVVNGLSVSWLSQDDDNEKLHYAKLMTKALLNIKDSVTFSLYATDTGEPPLTSETKVTFNVDSENSIPVTPRFQRSIYIADHTDLTAEKANEMLINFDSNITLSQGANSTVEYSLVDNIADYAENFKITTSEDYNSLFLTLVNVSDELLLEKFVVLTLTATKSGAAETSSTILHVSLPGLICSNTIQPIETITSSSEMPEDAIYCSTPSTTDEVTSVDAECPICEASTECPPTVIVEPECPTENSQEYECNCDTNNATDKIDTGITDPSDGTSSADLEEVTSCPVSTSTKNCICDEIVTPTESSSIDGSDEKDDSGSSTSEMAITTDSGENESIVSTEDTNTDNTSSLSFQQSIYIIKKNATFTGVLMTERATANNVDGKILYSIVIQNQDLDGKLQIDSGSGEVTITATIKPNEYIFYIVATIEDLDLMARATVVLTINAIPNECHETETLNTFDYALRIVYLEEESAHQNIVPLDDNGCDYVISSQSPDQNWVFVQKNTLNTAAIDRESPRFHDMSVAQVRVVLDMICKDNETSDSNQSPSRTKRNTMYEVLSEDVPYVRTRMIVVIIVTDINDNPPIWSPDTPTAIGFPSYNLLQLIHTYHVYRFSATDADIGDNALVTYTQNPESKFYIRPVEGTIYVQHGIYVEDGDIVTVIATDGRWNATATVTIRALESNNVAVLYVKNAVLEDVDDVLQKLSDFTGHRIRSLGDVVVFDGDELRFSQLASGQEANRANDDEANTLLRMMIYGLTKDKDPLSSRNLIDLVDATEIQWNIVEKIILDEAIVNSLCEVDAGAVTDDAEGLWAAVITLTVLLVLTISGFIAYTFYRRNTSLKPSTPKLDDSCSSTESAVTTSRKKSVVFKDTVEEIEFPKL